MRTYHKTILFCFCLFLAIANEGIAQIAFRGYAGINHSKITKELIENSKWKAGVGYQFGIDFQFGDKFIVQPGIQFEAFKNTKRINIPVTNNTTEAKLTYSYLRIPLQAAYRILGKAEDPFGMRLGAGFNTAFKISGDTDSDSGDIDIDDELKSAVFGINGGLGIDFLSILFADLGYQIGITDVFKNVEGFNSGAKNNFFYLNIGIKSRF